MLVNASEIELRVMQKALEREYNVLTMNNAKQALGRLSMSNVLPDIIVVDSHLQGGGGLTFANGLRTNPKFKDISVIMLTDGRDDASELEGYNLGISDFIYKPINGPILKRKIDLQLEAEGNKKQLNKYVSELQQNVTFHAQNSLKLEYFLIGMITDLLSKKDGFTGTHCVSVSRYMGILLQDMLMSGVNYGIPKEDYEIIVLSAQLHDMGKMGVPDSVLMKEGKYTDEEFQAMKNHPVYAADAIQKYSYLLPNNKFVIYMYQMARYHHERFDGHGYPDRLSGYNIPFLARVLAVADVYDALTAKRTYKETISHEKACSIIMQGSGTQFDPQVVNTFMRVNRLFYETQMQVQQQLLQQAIQQNQSASLMSQSQRMTSEYMGQQ